jgi:predicted dehydrogenase
MIRIGIVGSDNSHAERFSELCNLKDFPGRVKGARVIAIYGHDPKRTAEVAEKGKIPCIVRHPSEMLGKVDAVLVVFRHGGLHARYALPFIEAGVPTFVDKPFAAKVSDARRMVRAARKHGTPLTSFSTLRCAPSTVKFLRGLSASAPLVGGVSAGPGDADSQYGGFIFYGIHAIELMQEAFGVGAQRVTAVRHASSVAATVEYKSGATVSLQVMSNIAYFFHLAVYGKGGAQAAVLDSTGCYEAGLELILKMVRTGKEPLPHENMVEAVAIGEAVMKSFQTGKAVKLPSKLL